MNPKKIAKNVLGRMGYTVVKSSGPSSDNTTHEEREFFEIFRKCKNYTLVSAGKSFALYNAVRYISRNKIPGDFVECGVWAGGQAMIMAYALLKEGDTERQIHLYDTYRGMSDPTEADVAIRSQEPAKVKWEKEIRTDYNEWCYASLQDVKANVFSTGYPQERILFVEGKVEETIPGKIPNKISLLRLDTDWYESTYHEFKYLYPILEIGGVLIIDDYDTWEGSRKATDQYIKENDLKILLNKIGKGRIAVKI